MKLRDPSEILILDDNGNERKYTLSKFSAWDGAEINMRYPTHLLGALAVPKMSDWTIIEALQLKIMHYVAVDINGRLQRLETKQLIDNHVPDAITLIQLLAEEVKYNNRFFRNGTLSTFLGEAFRVALTKISAVLTTSLEQSSSTTKPSSGS